MFAKLPIDVPVLLLLKNLKTGVALSYPKPRGCGMWLSAALRGGKPSVDPQGAHERWGQGWIRDAGSPIPRCHLLDECSPRVTHRVLSIHFKETQ